jgi:Transglycosylase SLT domain
MRVKPSYLLLVGGGAIIAYSGFKDKHLGSAFREVISGQNPKYAATDPDTAISGTGTGTTPAQNAAIIGGAGGITAQQEAGGTAVAKRNQAIARPLAIAYGWGSGNQWQSLIDLWNQESGWNNYAYNASGATGIPQSLPATKMPLLARLPSQGGRAIAALQIAWGLSYIKSTYGSPAVAWAHEVANNWY